MLRKKNLFFRSSKQLSKKRYLWYHKSKNDFSVLLRAEKFTEIRDRKTNEKEEI